MAKKHFTLEIDNCVPQGIVPESEAAPYAIGNKRLIELIQQGVCHFDAVLDTETEELELIPRPEEK